MIAWYAFCVLVAMLCVVGASAESYARGWEEGHKAPRNVERDEKGRFTKKETIQ